MPMPPKTSAPAYKRARARDPVHETALFSKQGIMETRWLNWSKRRCESASTSAPEQQSQLKQTVRTLIEVCLCEGASAKLSRLQADSDFHRRGAEDSETSKTRMKISV